MAKYRKLPVVIEAFQMTKERRWDNSEWPVWLHEAWQMEPEEEGSLYIDDEYPDKENLLIRTEKGVYHITWDDFIIQGVKGELYPCKPDIFWATYEEAD